MDLALFDFDGTITTRGTYPGFIRFAIRPRRKVVAGIILGALIVGYRVGLVSDRAIRKAMSRVVFRGEQPERLRRLGERYAAEALSDLMRPPALERIAWHKSRGDLVVVVSASLDVYLEPWCATMGVDVVCTQLEARGGRVTGRYLRGDCCGEEKARRIRERYALREYGTVYGYGDTEEDREMLDMADKKFFRWQEVSQLPDARPATRRGDRGI
jgi:phosphatidylglycerophosphatase C